MFMRFVLGIKYRARYLPHCTPLHPFIDASYVFSNITPLFAPPVVRLYENFAPHQWSVNLEFWIMELENKIPYKK